MPVVLGYALVAAVIGGGLGYSLSKTEDLAKLALIGGGMYIAAKAFKVIK